MSAPLRDLPLAELRGVWVGRGEPALQDVNFTLLPGEAWLIGGPNGGGKSTLLKLLRGELSPVRGTRRYFLGGAWRTSAVQAKRELALVSPEQEAFYLTRQWVQTVSDVLLSGLSGEALRLWEAPMAAQARLQEVAAQLQLTSLLTRDVRTLSHGQRRRTLLGRALMPRPAALLLDEFTDGLSVSARAELRGVLRDVWQAGTAVVLVTHRPEEAPDLPWQHVYVAGGQVQRQALPAPLPARPARWLGAPPPATGKVLVELQRAEVYRNGLHALGPLSWQWREGQHWLVTGDNGAGKSTLARLVAGEFYPAVGGQVRRPFLARDVLGERRKHIGLLGAEVGIRQRRDWRGYDIIASGFAGTEGFAPPLSREQRSHVHAWAQRLEVGGLLGRRAEELSQGQLRRLLLARATVQRPRLLILDEGLDFLDAASRQLALGLLPELMQSGTQVLVVAHRQEDAPPGLNAHLHLVAGQLAAAP